MNESGKLSRKRKLSEYRDPDYEQKNEINTKTATTSCEKLSNLPKKSENEKASISGAESPKFSIEASGEQLRLQRTREIIAREFQREINHYTEEMEIVDNNIEEAIKIFDKLRYTLVENYYRKQEAEISTKEAAQLRGENTLFVNEPYGAQLPLHPALKQIIGKRPSSLVDALRMHPKRTAAQNAQQKIDEVTNSMSNKHKRREERRLQKIIRDRGIVIDHSKQQQQQQQAFDLEQAQLLSQAVAVEQSKPLASMPQVPVASKPLNTTRLNNKIKHLIAVGNTSQYIGDDNVPSHSSSAIAGQQLSHKWLVYVQPKDPECTPLERLVEKVRFFLHESYRPNDVVDIISPPFQLSRRGWGEFPVRLQIYFNENLQQKPVQLIHNLVLDKTLSGLQTMGAETIVEVWLRPLPNLSSNNNNNKTIDASNEVFDTTYNNSIYNSFTNDDNDADTNNDVEKKRTYSLGLSEMKDNFEDDNIFDFLNRIEATPSSLGGDLEKIEPTISLNDSFSSIVSSPTKYFSGHKSPEKKLNKSPHKNIIYSNNNQTTNTISVDTTSNNPTKIKTEVEIPMKMNENILSSKPKQQPEVLHEVLETAQSSLTTTKVPIPIISNNNINSLSIAKNSRFNTLKQPATPKPSIICLNTLNDASATTTTATTTLSPSVKAPIIVASPKIVLQKNVQIAHYMKPNITTISTTTTTTTTTQSSANQITTVAGGIAKPVQTYGKKLVKLVDAQGKIKYVQMLVVKKQNSTNISANNNNNNKNTNNLIQSAAAPATTPSTQIINTGRLIPNINLINKNKLQNSTRTMTNLTNQQFPKNTPDIFLKEGKLYVRDPQQMKLKQQQKQQTSLLKPQVSLLKHQQQQQKPTSNFHNVAPKLQTSTQFPAITKLNLIKSTKKNLIFNQNGFIIRATIEQEELEKCERIKLEESFQRLKFTSTRAAVEFLLRRLPLIAINNLELMKDFVFVRCRTELEYQQLPTFKQRSCEWLRAKYIAKCLLKHEQLKKLLQHHEIEVYWTTREIVLFARRYAYTPPIKSLSVQEAAKPATKYADILRKEVNLEKEQVQYETLTSNEPISEWMDEMSTKFKVEEIAAKDELVIDVVGDESTLEPSGSKTTNLTTANKANKNNSEFCTLAVPRDLESAAELVQEVCRSLNVPLQAEKVAEGTRQPLAKIVLAQCVRVFVEQLVRRAVATRLQEQEQQPQQQQQQQQNCDLPTVRLQDIGKALVEFGQPAEETGNNYAYSEYDFLTNCYLGVPQLDNESENEHA